MLRALLAVVSIGLTIFALADCIQTEEKSVRGIPKWGWIVLIVLIPWAGPLTWLFVGKERNGEAGTGLGRATGPRRQGPTAPDEDPEFLRKLDEDIRRERRERERQQREQQSGSADTDAPADGPGDDDPEQ